ncbi:peptide/nickel transport system permease protein [Antricoccus suffuscus]|uniref:Peptide/nickel transport system permease protein n=1 Tax=Antricoccus suffuscus TaxID=1629062 RepID=A0A2T0ZYP3_9ACTN|nr:ABC transporter permease [Antricoccus suffuscus]PRZ41466.1 peptide/nickel transport system permease protein [Antricoccus suffuscus]
MTRFIASRVLQAILLILAVIVLNFLLIHLAPGDAAGAIAGSQGGSSPAQMAQIRHDFGLDKPLLVQLGSYLWQVLHGNFGYSFWMNSSVMDLVLPRLGATLLLAVTGLLIGAFVGTLMGLYSAWKPRGIMSYVVTVVALVGFSAPAFWTGIMLVIIFAIWVPFFPTAGMQSIIVPDGALNVVGDVAWHLVLPAFTLGIIYIALYARTGRASMLEVLGSDYIRTAWAKGLRSRKVVFKHAFRNALIPLVTLAGLQVGSLISSAILIEVVFNWPGIGRLALDSVSRRDTPVLLGILAMSAVLVIVANLITDIVYRIIDPRISVKSEAS